MKSEKAFQAKFMQCLQQASIAEGDAKVALLEQAAGLADQHGDVYMGVVVRIKLVQAYNAVGMPEQSMVALTWALGQYDKDPENLVDHAWSLGWYYKWVVEHAPEFPQISRQQLKDLFADMRRRYDAWGFESRPVHQYETVAAQLCGDAEAAAEVYELWQKVPRGPMADCAACEADAHVKYHLRCGDLRRALKVAKPLLTGRLVCNEVPQATYSRMLVPLLKAGELALAVEVQKKSVTKTQKLGNVVELIAPHIIYYAVTDQAAKGVRLFERFVADALATRATYRRMHFCMAGSVLFRRMAGSGREAVKLRVPNTLAWHRDDGTYSKTELAEWCLGEARKIVAAFNQRNGNRHFDCYLSEHDELLTLTRKVA